MPPPPLPDPLHWVTVAPVVLAGKGEHKVVGAVPPPVPDPLHWFTVAAVGVVVPVMRLTTSTAQVTVPPPPLPDPLHWSIEVTRLAEVIVDELQTIVAGALAAPWHSVRATVELATFPSRVFVTVYVQSTAWPPTLSVPLHWLSDVCAVAVSGAVTRIVEMSETRKTKARIVFRLSEPRDCFI